MIYPGFAVSLVVIGFNLLRDALRDSLEWTESRLAP